MNSSFVLRNRAKPLFQPRQQTLAFTQSRVVRKPAQIEMTLETTWGTTHRGGREEEVYIYIYIERERERRRERNREKKRKREKKDKKRRSDKYITPTERGEGEKRVTFNRVLCFVGFA